MNEKHLIFVYNADGDLFSSLSEFAHKILSPSTYQCQLCALTYGNFSMKDEWKSFIESLPIEVIFLYKDKFKNMYKIEAAPPAVYIYDIRLKEFLSKELIEQCETLHDLKQLIAFKIKEHDQHHHTHL